MWDLPGPGLKPMSPALADGFLTTVPPGKPCTLWSCAIQKPFRVQTGWHLRTSIDSLCVCVCARVCRNSGWSKGTQPCGLPLCFLKSVWWQCDPGILSWLRKVRASLACPWCQGLHPPLSINPLHPAQLRGKLPPQGRMNWRAERKCPVSQGACSFCPPTSPHPAASLSGVTQPQTHALRIRRPSQGRLPPCLVSCL